MTTIAVERTRRPRSWVEDKLFMGQTFGEYVGSLFTLFNAIAAIIVVAGLVVAFNRFTLGLGATTSLTDAWPWGLWIGFDVLCGVALAAGGYTLATTVYVLRLKEYHPIVRPAVLTGFLGYFFVVIGLLFDLGRPWRLPYPIAVSYGVTSVMFLVAWHVFLYLSCQFVEFSPAVFEWLGWKRFRKWAVRVAVGATIFGVMLSTLHQSALGGLFLLAPGKLHPLWYSPLLPIFFFVSSIFAGISMVIVESTLSHRIFSGQVDEEHRAKLDRLTIGLGKAAAVVMFTYFGLKIIGLMHADGWGMLNDSFGRWFLIEILGFVAVPCCLFAWGYRIQSLRIIRFAAVLAVLGIIFNRLNVAMIAFNYTDPNRYYPAWSEYVITLSIVTVGLLTFRWIVNRMPVLRPHPEYAEEE